MIGVPVEEIDKSFLESLQCNIPDLADVLVLDIYITVSKGGGVQQVAGDPFLIEKKGGGYPRRRVVEGTGAAGIVCREEGGGELNIFLGGRNSHQAEHVVGNCFLRDGGRSPQASSKSSPDTIIEL